MSETPGTKTQFTDFRLAQLEQATSKLRDIDSRLQRVEDRLSLVWKAAALIGGALVTAVIGLFVAGWTK